MKTQKKNIFLLILVLFLLILYLLSFKVGNTSKDKRKPLKTALVNSKYEKSISNFILQKNGEALVLQKINDRWFIVDSQNLENFLPAEKNKVETFIKDLTKIINMYKISDDFSQNNHFGFDSSECFSIIYDGVNELKFGSYDFTKTSRYLMTGKNTKVYEISTELDKYLSTSMQNWCDPNIIFSSIVNLKPSDIQSIHVSYDGKASKLSADSDNFLSRVSKLFELRHGGFGEGTGVDENIGTGTEVGEQLAKTPEMAVDLEGGDSSTITLRIFPTQNESVFNIEEEYSLGFKKETYKFTCKISLWTYNKIKEIML